MDKKKTGSGENVSSGWSIRKSPATTPIAQAKSQIRKPSPAIQRPGQGGAGISSSTGAVGGGIKLRKNIFPPGKLNPTDLKIKSASAGPGKEPVRPMCTDSGNRTLLRSGPEPTQGDQDEDALEILYSRYLQKRLGAQAIAERRRLEREANAKKLADRLVTHVMIQQLLEPQIFSASRIVEEAKKLQTIEDLHELLLPFMRKLCEQTAEATFEQVANDLSEVLDILKVRNGTVPPNFSSSDRLTKISESIREASANPKSTHTFGEGITSTRCDLQAVGNASMVEEKEVNEGFIKLISLLFGQSALKRQLNIRRG